MTNPTTNPTNPTSNPISNASTADTAEVGVRAARWTCDRGSTTIFIAVLAIGFIMCAGLAIDGGRKLGALAEARDLADNAARVGAQQVDLDANRTGGGLTLDATAAQQAAMNYLAGVGESGTAVVAGDTITVTVTITATRRFLPGNMTVSAAEDASAVSGIVGANS